MGQLLEQRMDSPVRVRAAAFWPWPVGARVLLAIVVLISGVALRAVSHSLGSVSRSTYRVAPVLVIDPNTAPASVLEALPHVGPKLVDQLIKQREIRPFESSADLRWRVRGLGPATLARLSPHLRIKFREKPVLDSQDPRLAAAPGQPRLAQGPRRPSSSR
jgi:competence protein ComEA